MQNSALRVSADSPHAETGQRSRTWLGPLDLSGIARAPWAIAFGLALSLMLLRQPYRGVRHDALLYTGQALRHIDPSWTAHDIFFQFGSQDQFSLFSNGLAILIQQFGIGRSELVLLLACQALTLYATCLLTWEWTRANRFLALLAVGGLTHYFGAGRMFSLMEPFLTARSLAEPLAILAIAALLRGRLAWAIGSLTLSMLMHPLVAIPAAIAGWFYLIGRDRRWLWGLAALGAAVLLAWSGLEPFDRLRRIYDEPWLAIVAVVNVDVFITSWSIQDFVMALGDLLVLGFALRGEKGALASFSRSAIVATWVLCLVSVVGADFCHNILITQLQLWRSLWVLHLMYVLWLPGLVLKYWRKGALGRLAAANLIILAPVIAERFPNGWAVLAWAIALLLLSERGPSLTPFILRLLVGASVVLAVGSTGMIAWSLAFQKDMHLHGLALSSGWSIPFYLAIWTVPFACILLSWSGQARMSWLVLAAILVGAGCQFDQRTPWARYVEASEGQGHPFQAFIPQGAQVYWEDLELAPIWFMLRRPSFIGAAQFSGLLFSQQASAVARARWPLMVPISNAASKCSTLEGYVQDGSYHFQDCLLPEDDFFNLCRDMKNHADFLVTSVTYGRPPVAQWRFEPPDGAPPVTYFLHDCRSIRDAGQKSLPFSNPPEPAAPVGP